jgi:hypothetical protein
MRVGSDAAPAAGRGRFSRTRAAPGAPPGGHYEPSARSMALGARSPVVRFAQNAKPDGRNGRSLQSAARRSKEDAAMARHEAPASLERERGTNEQWLRHLARHLPRLCVGEIVENSDRPAQGLDKQHGR